MQSNALKNEMAVIKQLKFQPFITLLLPFDPKMTSKHMLEKRLKSTLEKIKNELYENYSFIAAKEVYDHLLNVVSNLDYNTHKKSVAMLVSSEGWKVYYLDVAVEEKFFVSDSFEFRQLVHYQKDEKEYLLLILNSNLASVYRGQGQTISKILQNVPDYKRNAKIQGKSNSLTDPHIDQQTLFEFFLQLVDKNLSHLLNAFSLPVFVLAPQPILDDFIKITHNQDFIIGFLEENVCGHSDDEIERAIRPYIDNWQKVNERFLMQELESASEEGKLEAGIVDVWNLAKGKNVRLLVIEEGYEYQAYLGKGFIFCAEEAFNNVYVKDAVDDAIEKVLADGGKVAFVSNGVLNDYMHIAAIRNYS